MDLFISNVLLMYYSVEGLTNVDIINHDRETYFLLQEFKPKMSKVAAIKYYKNYNITPTFPLNKFSLLYTFCSLHSTATPLGHVSCNFCVEMEESQHLQGVLSSEGRYLLL